jgi:hypothetical protein
MGSAVNAACDCGITATILVGAGMATFGTTCFFPGLCENCRSVVQVDVLAKESRCPECEATGVIPYDDVRLAGAPGQRVVVEWAMQEELGRELVLTDGNYKCPSCEKLSLRFSDGGMLWD